MEISVKYFAIIRETLGRSEERREIPPGTTTGQVLDQLGQEHPTIAPLKSALMLMVNQEYARLDHVLEADDELALIPPVSGGSGNRYFQVQSEVLDPRNVERFVEDPGVGGIVTFSGTVRARARGMDVTAIDYEAYVPAAEKMLARIGDEIFERWQVSRVAIVHRTGYLTVGEVSVVIAVGSAHRAEAFAAAEYAIDRIKEIVPIWKKEFYEDGSHWVGTEAEYQQQVKQLRPA